MTVNVQRAAVNNFVAKSTLDQVGHLEVGEVLSIKRASLTLSVHAGDAWLTLDAQDIFLNPGGQYDLGAGKYPAVLSVMGSQKLIYSLA